MAVPPSPSPHGPVAPCPPGQRCGAFWPGHALHWIHAKHLGQQPEGWRDGVVIAVDGRWLDVGYALEDGAVRAWHHAGWHTRWPDLQRGAPVRVHEGLHAVSAPAGLVNVVLDGGLGAVPEPEHAEQWRTEVRVAVTDHATGAFQSQLVAYSAGPSWYSTPWCGAVGTGVRA